LRRVHLPLHRVAAGPVAAGARADVDGHADSVAGVKPRAAHLRQVPAGPEIARTPLRIRLETAAREHDLFAAQLGFDAVVAHAPPAHPHTAIQQAQRARAVANFDPTFGGCAREHLDQTGPAPDRLDGQAAPEFELTFDLEGLAAVDRNEAHALVAHPAERVEAS